MTEVMPEAVGAAHQEHAAAIQEVVAGIGALPVTSTDAPVSTAEHAPGDAAPTGAPPPEPPAAPGDVSLAPDISAMESREAEEIAHNAKLAEENARLQAILRHQQEQSQGQAPTGPGIGALVAASAAGAGGLAYGAAKMISRGVGGHFVAKKQADNFKKDMDGLEKTVVAMRDSVKDYNTIAAKEGGNYFKKTVPALASALGVDEKTAKDMVLDTGKYPADKHPSLDAARAEMTNLANNPELVRRREGIGALNQKLQAGLDRIDSTLSVAADDNRLGEKAVNRLNASMKGVVGKDADGIPSLDAELPSNNPGKDTAAATGLSDRFAEMCQKLINSIKKLFGRGGPEANGPEATAEAAAPGMRR